jgi:hypothetical protein
VKWREDYLTATVAGVLALLFGLVLGFLIHGNCALGSRFTPPPVLTMPDGRQVVVRWRVGDAVAVVDVRNCARMAGCVPGIYMWVSPSGF